MRPTIALCVLSANLLFSCSAPGDADPEETEAEGINVTLIEGTNMAVALSPDQTTLAMALQGTIWSLPAGGGKATPLTDDMDDSQQPVWSPDGERIAFHSYRRGSYDIWTIGADGSDLQQITEGSSDDREPVWSPDGNRIIFSSDRSDNYDLWQVELGSGTLKQLTFDASNDYYPSVAPDGERIAFVSEREPSGIYMLKDGAATLLAPSSARLVAPSWNAGGDQLLFTAYEGGVGSMYLAQTTVGSTQQVVTGEDLFPFRASWTSDRTFLYTADGKIKKRMLGEQAAATIPFEARVTLHRPEYERKTYDFDSRRERLPLGIIGPVVSPDGNKIAFTALGDLYVQQIGGELIQITDDQHVDLDPDWSPDGSTLAYVSDRGGKMQVWLRDLQTGREWRLTTGFDQEAVLPAWSPDGTHVAFHTADYRKKWGSGIVTIADVATGEVRTVHDSVFVPSKASWSPDGNTLALMALKQRSSRYREGVNQFLLVSLKGEAPRLNSPDNVSALGMRNQNGPVWAPDGRKMAYIKDGVLWTVPVNEKGEIDGNPVQITEELADNISWTADSKHIVYIATDRLKKINLENGSTEEISIDLRWRPELPTEDYIIHAGRLFNGLDSTYIEQADILVSGHRISDVFPHQEHGKTAVVDASDKVVMPGLFEMHSHQSSSTGLRLGKLWLSYGITSVRDPGSDPYDSLERKESWSSGTRPGPRLFFTGGLTDGARIYYGLANSVADSSHLRMELERADRLGYNLIKTYVRMPDAMQKQITEAAHRMGIPVSSHELYPAAKYNVDATEHLSGTSRRGYSLKLTAGWNTYSDVIELLTRSGMSLTPTISMYGGFERMAATYDELLHHAQFKAFHAVEYRQKWVERTRQYEGDRDFETLQQTVVSLIEAGGTVTAGTDSPFLPFGSSLHAELWLYVDGGLTPFEALQTATIHAAQAVGVAGDLGSVEPGKLADMVIVDGDPLHRIQDALKVESVIKNGIVYPVVELMGAEE